VVLVQAESETSVGHVASIGTSAATLKVDMQSSELQWAVTLYVNVRLAPLQSTSVGSAGIEPIFVVTPQPFD